MKEEQRLIAIPSPLRAWAGIVQGVDVQGEVGRGLIEEGDEVVKEDVVQLPEGGDVYGVLEAGEKV